MNAAISGMHQNVLEESKKWQEVMANKGALNEQIFFEILENLKNKIEDLFNIPSERFSVQTNSSENFNYLAMMMKDGEKKKIIVPANDFPSSVLPWYYHGFDVVKVEPKNYGNPIEDLLAACDTHTAAVVSSHVQFQSGYRQDIITLGKKLKEMKIDFILNGTQSIGAFPIPLKEAHVSAMTASCHKWLGGGLGAAILYMSEDFQKGKSWPMIGWCSVEDPWSMKNDPPTLRNDVSSLQLGTLNFTGLATLAKALEVHSEIGAENCEKRIIELSDYLFEGLLDLDVQIQSQRNETWQKTGIINFRPHNKDSEFIVEELAKKDIHVNCRRGDIRASVHFYNTKKEIDLFLQALKLILES